MEVQVYVTEPSAAVADGCIAVYAAAFGQPPYAETPSDAALLGERISRYAGRDGFRLPVAADREGHVAGFALAVRAYRGDWWRDQVAGAVGPELTERWLPPGVLEVVHVAVDPARQRQGIGRALLTSLLASLDPGTSTAVLSCDHAALPAQQLYLSAGWHLITAGLSFGPGMPPRRLMGLDLRVA